MIIKLTECKNNGATAGEKIFVNTDHLCAMRRLEQATEVRLSNSTVSVYVIETPDEIVVMKS